ncbi:DUF6572 domain-containing protein [Kosakonia cowanii]|uniref:DUF6572 domain-containing protein n=1 Tax=Kosakonia TaxID=1330547 RepID=UPI000B95D323|nr:MULTISPECIES: DUF6572 domain-containing protein [Kosakonia]AST68375.1 hypothetical protein BFG07_06640 [Kosakonia cowanii]MDM9617477.1 hypothetical protein [Kosakonia cowanii]MDP4562638.1 hypothetical protein [Kosakonia cowanii]QNQ23007.1 hypothetical protein HF650_24970 [Kosakonia sp. SMBL-WEM22]
MSVEDLNTIDCIGIPIENPNEVNLGISDHLDWDASFDEHLFLLQEKLNTYLRFIESGEIYQSFPPATQTTKKVIEIFCKYQPSSQANPFLNHVTDCIKELGIELKIKVEG